MISTRKRRLADYTLDDWDRLEPVEGHRVELVDGLFRVNPAPMPRHQRIVARVGRLIAPVAEPLGWDVLTAVGIRVRPGLGYIPDLESPSTRKTDRFEKPTAYATAGIQAYWRIEVVKHRPPVMFCYLLDNGVYAEVAVIETGKPLEIDLPVGGKVVLDVDQLAALPRR